MTPHVYNRPVAAALRLTGLLQIRLSASVICFPVLGDLSQLPPWDRSTACVLPRSLTQLYKW